ncbi:hypothetical protein ACFX2I_026081 [Malus domestica]|uniref:Epidermal patterning factor-like protein n=1 Tax=Malus domestica TaxID=3750 RepID=A0A498KJ08_MALDO|nr:hypothetical protein DVH24_017777 [Malus domestica]
MASSRNHPNGLKITVAVMFLIFFLTFFPSISAESMLKRAGDQRLKNQMKMVLGSSPPRCVNKCMSCRPCTATLVASSHHKSSKLKAATYQGDESYYLLSWKCRCRNKLYQP